MMPFETIVVRSSGKTLTIALNRPREHNALNQTALEEIHAAFDAAEADPVVRAIIVEGRPGVFCTGLDFLEVMSGQPDRQSIEEGARLYYRTLERFTSSPKIVVAKIDGDVRAGGVGLVAASDFAIASEGSRFQLSEAVLGLMPANLMPCLTRRVGFQNAYRLTLTAQQVDARAAAAINLIDEAAAQLDERLRRFLVRIEHVPAKTVDAIKTYFRRLLPLPPDGERLAVAQIADMLEDPDNLARIAEFMQQGVWQGGVRPVVGGGN